MADLEISVDIDARGTKVGAAQARSEIKGIGDESEKTAKRVKTHSSAAAQDIKQIEQAAGDAARASQITGQIIGTVMGIIAAAAIAAAIAVISVTKAYAEQGVEVGKLQKQTGFTTETISALEMQFRRTKTSGDDFKEGMKNLTKTIGDAANGSEEAARKLARLGIDPVRAISNLDGALRDVLKRIVSLKSPVEQSNAAMDAFGENGYKLLPFIKSFNGDIDSLIKKARELGVTMSKDDVKAAEEFNRTFADVQETIRGLILTFGREYMPTVKTVLDATGKWFKDNKATIQDWAVSSGNALRGFMSGLSDLASWVENNPTLVRVLLGVVTMGGSELAIQSYQNFEQIGANTPRSTLPGQFTTDYTRPQPFKPSGYFSPKADKAGRAKAPQLTEEQKQAQDLQRTLQNLSAEYALFGIKTKESAIQQQYWGQAILGNNQALYDQAIAVAQNIDKKEADAKATADLLEANQKYAESLQQFKDTVQNSGFDTREDLTAQLVSLTTQIELGRELTEQEQGFIDNAAELSRVREDARRAGLQPEDIEEVVQMTVAEQQLTGAIRERVQALKTELDTRNALKSLSGELNGELAELIEQYRTGADVTTLFRVQQELLKDVYKGLSDEQKQKILDTAAEIDSMKDAIKAQEDLRQRYDDFRNSIRDSLQVLADEGFGGFFKSIKKKFQSFLLDMVADWLSSKFFSLFYKGGNAQTQQQNGQGGGIFGGLLGSIFGGNQNSGTGGFNPGYFTGQGGGANGGIGSGGGIFSNIFGGGGASSGGGILASLGGLLGDRSGTLDSAGNVIVDGRSWFKKFLGSGAFGGLIGIGVSLIAKLFGNIGRRRREEGIRNQGMLDAFEELKKFDTIIGDVRGLRMDPASGIAQGTALGEQVRAKYLEMANSLKDKKTRNKALADVSRIDAYITQKMAELRAVADIAGAAGERSRRMLPEFANGVYMSPAFMAFRRYNGMLGGAWTGRDVIPAMLARGEMVLNPNQQRRVIAAAGADVFKPAGIPGYAGGVAVTAPSQVMMGPEQPINIMVSIEQDAQGMFQVAATSDTGRKVLVNVVNDGFANNQIKTGKRGA